MSKSRELLYEVFKCVLITSITILVTDSTECWIRKQKRKKKRKKKRENKKKRKHASE